MSLRASPRAHQLRAAGQHLGLPRAQRGTWRCPAVPATRRQRGRAQARTQRPRTRPSARRMARGLARAAARTWGELARARAVPRRPAATARCAPVRGAFLGCVSRPK